MVEFPHAKEVNEPQLPERSCMRMFAGADETLTVCEDDCATKVYHTSYLSEAPQPGVGNVAGFHVAFTLVPAVFTQLVDEVRVIAAEHSSLPG